MQRLREQETSSDVALFQKRALNDRLMLAERGFLDVDGLRGRPWFKHLVSVSFHQSIAKYDCVGAHCLRQCKITNLGRAQ